MAVAVTDPAAQKRLLALAGSKSSASSAFDGFLPFATAALALRGDERDGVERAAGLQLLALAFASRHAAWPGAGDPKSKERVSVASTDRRHVAVFAAKIAQAALKACAGVGDKADAAVATVASMDLACCALYVTWTFESDARLGDMVLDNLLYQVAKKYSEVQQASAQAAAACVVACTHVRLWSLHSALCARNNQAPAEESRFAALARETPLDAAAITERLPWLAEFPAPTQVHSAQFTRLLLGIANTCVTLLLGARQYEGIYKAANDTVSRWICHLDTSFSQDGKLAMTLKDRTFRVLWKSASAVEASPQSNGQISESARLRALALTFMASCASYQPLQIILQVYRAGVQMERTSKRNEQDYKCIREFYMQAATLLSHKQPESRHIYMSKKLDWEYVQWIEHFASVCENARSAIDSAVLLESAVHYVWRLGELGQAIARALCCMIAGAFLTLATVTPDKPTTSTERLKCDERLKRIASKIFCELTKPATDGAIPPHQWEKAARVFLKKTCTAEEQALDGASSHLQQFVPLVTRCLKRGSIKLYGFATTGNSSTCSQLQAQISASFDTFCSMLRLLRSDQELDAKLTESVILTESRLSRLGFALAIRGYSGRNGAPRDSTISKKIERVQQLLDDTMTLGASTGVMQGILVDLNMIARESYACAARFYQSKNYLATLSALIGSFEVAESFLEYVMCSELSPEDIVKTHQQLKMDAIVSLLAYCYHEVGDTRLARVFSGHSVLYCSEASGYSQTSTDKYAGSLLEEYESQGEKAAVEHMVSEFEAFVECIVSAYKARHCADTQLVDVLHALRRSFQRASNRTMLTLRASRSGGEDHEKQRAVDAVGICAHCEHILDSTTLRLAGDSEDTSRVKTLLDVCSAITTRKVCYSVYYAEQNGETAIQGLLQAYTSLSTAIETLQFSDGVVELAVAYGWRGVLSMEIVLVSSYSGTSITADSDGAENSAISEDSALCDFEKCLVHFANATTTMLFNADRVVICLEAVCETLSLISCPPAELAARHLLQRFQSSCLHGYATGAVGPSPSFDLAETYAPADINMEDDVHSIPHVLDDKNASVSRLLRALDEDIACALSLHNDVDRACGRLRRAASMLNVVKVKARSARPPADLSKAIGMRQVVLHLALSDISFARGKTESAFVDAKAALAISWKLSKKFAANSSLEESAHFKLPAELSKDGKSEGHEDSSVLLYFQALEFSSWDILTGAKVALCRIAALYHAAGQPHRASTYYAEAMRLVGGLPLTLFNRDPFCRYAQLQLRSARPQHARIALRLIPHSLAAEQIAETSATNEASSSAHGLDARSRFRRQQCMELIQEGDLTWTEGDRTSADGSYRAAIEMLTSELESEPIDTTLRTLLARCWRKLVNLQGEVSGLHNEDDGSNDGFLKVMGSMKELRTALHDCMDPVEQVKCLLELGRQTLWLISKSRSKELSVEESIRLLERAFVRGHGFGIQHLSKELRVALGSAYQMQLDTLGDETIDSERGDDSEARFLTRASSVLLASSSGVEVKTDASTRDDDTDSSAEDYFSTKLDELVIQPQSRDVSARDQIAKFANTTVDQMKRLPASWLTVAITVGLSSELLLTRFSGDDDSPITFHLNGVRWEPIVAELHGIVEESRVTLSGHSAAEASAWTTEQKKRWWDTRKQLDTRMGNVIVKMQTALGFWRCLLVKGSAPCASQVAHQCWAALQSTPLRVTRCEKRLQTLLRAIVDSAMWLSDDEVDQGLQYIAQQVGGALSPSDTARTRHFLKEAVSRSDEHFDQPAGADSCPETQFLSSISSEAIHKMKVGEMKELLSAAGLSTSGLKKDLLERLIAARDGFSLSQSQARRHGRDKASHSSTNLDGSTIVVLDRCLLEFPWEGIDVLSACSGVTRMPSLDLVVANASRLFTPDADMSQRTSWRVRRSRIRYILNPSGDLKATQRQLGPILERSADALGWEGVVGRAPDPREFRRFLTESDLVIYCGHGSGETYLHREKIRAIESGCSAALLFGCSSGRLESEGVFGPDGAVVSYLRAGSPGVLAMLWDVTDKDIDQLSVEVLHQWLLSREGDEGIGGNTRALAHVVQASRSVCKLRYLNGHAAVCYGLPIHVATDT